MADSVRPTALRFVFGAIERWSVLRSHRLLLSTTPTLSLRSSPHISLNLRVPTLTFLFLSPPGSVLAFLLKACAPAPAQDQQLWSTQSSHRQPSWLGAGCLTRVVHNLLVTRIASLQRSRRGSIEWRFTACLAVCVRTLGRSGPQLPTRFTPKPFHIQ